MTAKDLFGLFVRIVALLLMLYGAYNIFYAGLEVIGQASAAVYPPSRHVVGGLFMLGLGLALMSIANWITALAYRGTDL